MAEFGVPHEKRTRSQGLLVLGGFIIHRRHIDQLRVSADAFVKRFDALEDARPRLLPGGIVFIMHQFFLSVAKKLSMGELPCRLMLQVIPSLCSN